MPLAQGILCQGKFNDGMNDYIKYKYKYKMKYMNIFYLHTALIFMVCHLLGLSYIFCSKWLEVAQKLEYGNTSPSFVFFPGSHFCSWKSAWKEGQSRFLRRPCVKNKDFSITELVVESVSKLRHLPWLVQEDSQIPN